MPKQEVVEIIEQLSEEQLEDVVEYLTITYLQGENGYQGYDEDEQELLELINSPEAGSRDHFTVRHHRSFPGFLTAWRNSFTRLRFLLSW
ncbi:hypothetical protein GF339_23960 [candidate division KSB3 bacterium]|uniref:DUF2281 domain-containing protein n=1 Tax=candidate division KSB3 bacterium TaxID=2044937 RepID=A0A9D5Q862_9BACT|nr:hypothetical protein [candidate division KSB3 bacterium]MBD3327660.1 hypothetical protein [candidate division KSB3 bacterium]